MKRTRKTFEFGGSTVIVLPRHFGIKKGIHYTFKQEGKKITMEPMTK